MRIFFIRIATWAIKAPHRGVWIMLGLMELWKVYNGYVEAATQEMVHSPVMDIAYWRNRLFKNFILYSLPVSLLALIPAIPIGIMDGHPYLIAFDILIVVLMGSVALTTKLDLQLRKIFVTLILYFFAVVAIANLGSFGPGILYLLATTVFSTLIFSSKLGYLSVGLHFLTCSIFAMAIHGNLFATPLSQQYTTSAWLAFSSNVIFLSLVFVVLISKIIDGLENTILQELGLQTQLQQEAAQKAALLLKLKESSGHYKSLFIQNPSPMWVIEAGSFRFQQVNEAAIKTYGYSKEEFMKMRVHDLRLSPHAPGLDKNLAEQHELGERHNYVTKHRRKDSKTFDVEIQCNTIIVDGKQAILAIGRDITEQRRYIQAIEAQNYKLQEVAYIQSHAVRAPLAKMLSLLTLIKLNNTSTQDSELIELLDTTAKELDEIIKKIADGTLVYDTKGLNHSD
jgi:PAS domain S-box-containing protein